MMTLAEVLIIKKPGNEHLAVLAVGFKRIGAFGTAVALAKLDEVSFSFALSMETPANRLAANWSLRDSGWR